MVPVVRCRQRVYTAGCLPGCCTAGLAGREGYPGGIPGRQDGEAPLCAEQCRLSWTAERLSAQSSAGLLDRGGDSAQSSAGLLGKTERLCAEQCRFPGQGRETLRRAVPVSQEGKRNSAQSSAGLQGEGEETLRRVVAARRREETLRRAVPVSHRREETLRRECRFPRGEESTLRRAVPVS